MRLIRHGRVDRADGWTPESQTDAGLQWWYFDGEFESGHHFMVIMLPRNFGRVHGCNNGADPTLTMTLTDPSGRHVQSQRFYSGEFSADATCTAKFGSNEVEYRNGRYRLRIDQDGQGCDLEYQPEFPPWAPLPGYRGYMSRALLRLVQLGRGAGSYFHYASMVPRAKVHGTLTLDGNSVEVVGRGYHEQGRTNVALTRVFSYWYWTRLYVGDWCFIFPVSQTPHTTFNTTMRALLVYHRDERVCDTFDATGLVLRHEVHRTQHHEASGRELPLTATFSARLPGFRLRMEMEVTDERTAFCFDYLDHQTPLQPAWLQHLMQVRVQLRWRGQDIALQGQGVFESMLSGAV